MATTDAREYDFTRTAANAVNADSTVIMEHFVFASDLMRWFVDEGLDTLNSSKYDDFEVWRGVFDKAFYLLRDFNCSRPVCALFVRVVERGVDGLVKLATSDDKKLLVTDGSGEEVVSRWWKLMMYQLQPGVRCGINSSDEVCTPKKTLELLDRLVVVAQSYKSERMLATIAENRQPNYDDLARKLYIAHHKNW